jgi:hypothetical protein
LRGSRRPNNGPELEGRTLVDYQNLDGGERGEPPDQLGDFRLPKM